MTFRDFGRFLEILEDFRPARARRVRANLEKFGFLEDFSRFWKIFDPHVPEGFVQTLKSLDFWKIFRDFGRFFRPARARRVRANLEKFGFLEDSSRFWKIFDPHVPEGFVQNLKTLDFWKMFRDFGRFSTRTCPKGSCKPCTFWIFGRFFEILEDFSRFWKIFDPHVPEGFVQTLKILDFWKIFRDFGRFFEILEDFLRFWKIFDPHVPEGFVQTLKTLDFWKIFRDFGRFFEILEDFSRFWKIFDPHVPEGFVQTLNILDFWKIFRDFGRFSTRTCPKGSCKP